MYKMRIEIGEQIGLQLVFNRFYVFPKFLVSLCSIEIATSTKDIYPTRSTAAVNFFVILWVGKFLSFWHEIYFYPFSLFFFVFIWLSFTNEKKFFSLQKSNELILNRILRSCLGLCCYSYNDTKFQCVITPSIFQWSH